MPGRAMVVLPTLMASDSVTKNQPPAMETIMFQIRGGVANGASMRQKRAQADRPNSRPASVRSSGTARNDWYMLKAMFGTWLVKMTNTQASSAPSTRPGARDRNHTTVTDKKPRMG